MNGVSQYIQELKYENAGNVVLVSHGHTPKEIEKQGPYVDAVKVIVNHVESVVEQMTAQPLHVGGNAGKGSFAPLGPCAFWDRRRGVICGG
jgi:hypothetical protein